MDTINVNLICNMTPHALHVRDVKKPDGCIEIPPCGVVPRMLTKKQEYSESLLDERIQVVHPSEFAGVDIVDFEKHAKKEMPIVLSRFVAQYLREIDFVWPGGVYSPDSGPESAIRDEQGRIIGVERLEGSWCRKS